jgi:hypothetical protein
MSAPFPFPPNSDLSAIGMFDVFDTDYSGGMVPNDSMKGSSNLAALQAAINTAIQDGGGLVFIPTGTYYISGTVAVQPVNSLLSGIIIAGTSGGTTLIQQHAGNTFSVQNLNNGNAVRFQDLTIQYDTSTHKTGIAIAVSNCNNVSCERVHFVDCPGSITFDANSKQCGLFNCAVQYSVGRNDQTAITIMGNDNYIDECVIRQAQAGPTGCTGIQVISATSTYVANTHISYFNVGLKVDGGSAQLRVSNVVSESVTTSVNIQPVSGGTISQVFFDSCVFALAGGTLATPGIYVDTANNPNSYVSDICFANCMAYLWLGAGIQINTGQNIQVNGGRFGSNAQAVATSGGISITGAAANVIIDGVDCSGIVGGQSVQQPYGISVTGAVAGAYVNNCNLTGNVHPIGLFVNVTGTFQLEVTECAGYNDQGTRLTSPPLNTTFSNQSLSYYGPIAFYVSGGNVTVSINGQGTGLGAGGFTLAPGAQAEINGSGSPSLLAVGK